MKKYPNITTSPVTDKSPKNVIVLPKNSLARQVFIDPSVYMEKVLKIAEPKPRYQYSKLTITPEFVSEPIVGYHREKVLTMTLEEFIEDYMVRVQHQIDTGFDANGFSIKYPTMYYDKALEEAHIIYNYIKD